jgi:dTMP kinase
MTLALLLGLKPCCHIAFTGIDGAGKSDQAAMLAFYIQQTYGQSYLAESRTDLVSQALHALAARHGMSRREYFGHERVDFAKSFDVVSNFFATLQPLLTAGMHVVEPRSVYCRSAMALGMAGARDEKTEEVLSLVPQPDLLFWIDTSPEIALKRIERRGRDSEKLEDLRRFSEAYRQMPESAGWIRINGNSTRAKIHKEIKKHVDALFTR